MSQSISEGLVLLGDFTPRAQHILSCAKLEHRAIPPEDYIFLKHLNPSTPVTLETDLRLTRLEEAYIDRISDPIMH